MIVFIFITPVGAGLFSRMVSFFSRKPGVSYSATVKDGAYTTIDASGLLQVT
ncbi:MAG: hypothetical protein WKI04_17755 [Ferruginibacter sp.]